MEYQYRFEAFVYEIKEAKLALRKFLKEQHSLEAFDFLERAKGIRDAFPLLQEEEKIEVVSCLLKYYINEKAPVLNISFELKNAVWSMWRSIRENPSSPLTRNRYNDLFCQVEYYVFRDMKLDVYPNFVFSPQFKQFIAKLSSNKQGKQILKQLVTIPNKYTYFGYTFSSLFESEIQNKDFEFAKMLLEDHSYCIWSSIGKNVYVARKSKLAYDVAKGSSISFAKLEGHIPCTINEARTKLLSTSNSVNTFITQILANCSFLEELEWTESSKTQKLHLLFNFKHILLNKRHTSCTFKWTSFDTESVLGICKSISPKNKHFKGKSLPFRFFVVIGLYSSTTVANQCRYTIQFLYHGEKQLQGKIMQSHIQQTLFKVCAQIRESIEKFSRIKSLDSA